MTGKNARTPFVRFPTDMKTKAKMNWSDVGQWIKENAGSGAVLAGSLLTGNIPAAVAAGVALVSSATGQADPAKALTALQTDPATMIRLKELALQESDSIRKHVMAMEDLRLSDQQKEQSEQQQTIRGGDNSEDEYVRRTRPLMARQSWYATMAYILVFEALKQSGVFSVGATVELAMVLIAPAGAYLGFRTWDKSIAAKALKNG